MKLEEDWLGIHMEVIILVVKMLCVLLFLPGNYGIWMMLMDVQTLMEQLFFNPQINRKSRTRI